MKTEKREITFVKIETTGFYDICNRLAELETENKSLKSELQDIKSMSMWEFSSRYCSAEQQKADGKAFARSLLGVGQ